ncbi:SusC/RagA family TonB-linked outer membrane protein [Chitinophagaceae bacterium LWZ2-11]
MNFKRLLAATILPLVVLCLPAFAQSQNVVTGKVTDSKSGVPLASVSVLVKGTAIGTSTGTDGSFSLKVPSTATTLVISSVSYGTKEIAIAPGTLNISLVSIGENLNEVVVIGYGTAKKKELTGSIATVGSKDFQQGAITTPEQLIAGKVAGVSITSNGGSPGQGSVIRIRGGASLSASNDPLIVIDGVPLSGNTISGAANPLSLINSNDIETFTILKDASATAIYGSRASNGVILITTKKGKSGKATFNFSTQFSVSKLSKELPVLSSSQFRTYVNENDTSSTHKFSSLLGTANTDWQKEIYQSALSTDNNLSVSGAVMNMPYRVSVGYLNQTGILRTDRLERYSAGIRLSPKFFDNHLKVDLNLNGAETKTRFANQGAIGAAAAFDPTQSVNANLPQYGNYFEWENPVGTLNPNASRNPVALINQKNDLSTVDRSYGNLQLDYKFHFLPELRANLNLGYDVAQGKGTTFVPANAAQSWTTKGTNNNYLQKLSNTVGEFYLNYVKDLASIKSNINVTAGYGYYDNLTTNYNYPSFAANGDTIAGSIPVFPIDKPRTTMISYYGRLIYTLDNKYILAASIRTDGSSRFGSNNRWGTFPSVALTWKIKEESFLKNSNFFSDLKIRASYGITGNQDGIPYYSYLPTYGSSVTAAQYQFGNSYYYMYAPAAYVADIRWEQTAASNIGVDFGFFGNRLTGSVDYYYKKTDHLLGPVNVPAGSNFTNQVITNVGSLTNQGIELTLNATPIKTKDLTWDVSFNMAYNNTKITNVSLPGSKDSAFVGNPVGSINGATGQTIQINTVGYAPNSFYVYKQVYGANGKPLEGVYADLNGDGIINQKDMYQYKSPAPKVIFGFSTQVSYKKWTFSTVLRANVGNYMYNNVNASIGVQKNILNPAGFLGNATTDIFKSGFVNNQYQSDYYIQNASFLKMDNLGVAYNVGRVWNNKVGVRINANCQNVFTATKYTGADPEVYGGIDNNFYPRPRIYVLGVNLNF